MTQSIAAGQVAPAGTTIDLVVGQAADPPPPTQATTTTTAPTGDRRARHGRAMTHGPRSLGDNRSVA